jgi:hypothetical protein
MKRPDRRERPTPMTHAERVAEIKGRFGFTERQAGFLVTVMLHAGVCLARQYCAFARIKYGEPMRTFFQTLEARRFVTPQTCAHGRARLFHVHYKPLYTAIGEPDNRFRRPMTLARAIERLMVLDAVLAGNRAGEGRLFHERGRAAAPLASSDLPLSGRGDRALFPGQAADRRRA